MKRYKRRVGVYRNIPVEDGYGGHTLTASLVGHSWADVKSVSADRLESFGLELGQQTIRIRCRYRDDIDYTDEGLYLTYNGKNWQPISVQEIDQFNREIEILAINVKIDDMPDIVYVPVGDGDGPFLIDGFTVYKGDGNTTTTAIEVGDFITGFFGATFVAGTVNTIPVTTVDDIDVALDGTPFP